MRPVGVPRRLTTRSTETTQSFPKPPRPNPLVERFLLEPWRPWHELRGVLERARSQTASIEAIRRKVRAALDDGGPMRVKAVLQELTDEIRIHGRDAIEPTFLIPAVRLPSGTMEPTEVNTNRFALVSGGRLAS